MSCKDHADYKRLLERYSVLKNGLIDLTALEDKIEQLKITAKEKDATIADLRLQLTEQRERFELLREISQFKMVQQSNLQFGNNFGGPPTLSLQAPPYSPISSIASVIAILPSDSASNFGFQIQPLTESRPPLFPSPALSSTSADGAPSSQGHGDGRGQGGEMLTDADMEDQHQQLETASSILSSLANNLLWKPFQPTQLNNINRGRGEPTCEFVIIRLPIILHHNHNKTIFGAAGAVAAAGHSTGIKYVVAEIHEEQKIHNTDNNNTKTLFRYEYYQWKAEKINGQHEKFVFMATQARRKFVCDEDQVAFYLPRPYYQRRGKYLFKHELNKL